MQCAVGVALDRMIVGVAALDIDIDALAQDILDGW